MNLKLILIIVMILFSFSYVNAAIIIGSDESLGVWGVDVTDVTPPTVPGIALEQTSDARVRLFLAFYPLDFSLFSNVKEYKIDHVYVSLAEADAGIKSATYKDLDKEVLLKRQQQETKEETETAEEDENDKEEGLLDTLTNAQKTGVVTVSLTRLGKGRSDTNVGNVSETAEEICEGNVEAGPSLDDLIPDKIDVVLRADIVFTAKKHDGTYVTEEEAAEKGVGFSESDVEQQAKEKYDKWVENNPGKTKVEKEAELKRIREDLIRYYRERPHYIKDTVYFNTTIGVDKTNIPVSPEQLKKQICGTITFREKVQKLYSFFEKVEDYAKNTCLLSLIGGSAQLLFWNNPCDAYDTYSIGCDWIFCPKDKCNGINPFYSLVGSTAMCLNTSTRFYDKDFIKEVNAQKEDTTEFMCEAKAGQGIPAPWHFVCISGIRGNLNYIDQMAEQYQTCLIRARQGGVSVGICDKIRSYYFCDRILGGFLTLTNTKGVQDWMSKITNFFVDNVVNGILPNKPEKAGDHIAKKSEQISFVGKQIAKDYSSVPFLRLFAEKDKFITYPICSAFVEGKLFNLEDIKSSLLTIPYPDNFYVLTEKRFWDYNEDMTVNSYSYDVFFQIYAGTAETYSWNSYQVYLKGTTLPDENGNGGGRGCTIVIASGTVPDGQLAQQNVFKVSDCEANKHCIKFRNKENCNDIGTPISVNDEVLDPFGLSLIGDDGNDNGISDAWENFFGIGNLMGDDDKDGCSNIEEYYDSTNPNDASSKGNGCSSERSKKLADEYKTKSETGKAVAETINGDSTEIENYELTDQTLPENFDKQNAKYYDNNGDGEPDYVETNGKIYEIDNKGMVKGSAIVDLADCTSKCGSDYCTCKSYCCAKLYGQKIAKGEACGERTDTFQGEYKINNDYNQAHQQTIINYATKYGVPIKLALAVAYQESQFQHCCTTASGSNNIETCEGRYDVRETCPSSPDLILKGDSGDAVGIMQISKKWHPDCFSTVVNTERAAESICNITECDGEKPRNKYCNIAASMNFLKQNYDKYGSGCKASNSYTAVKDVCDTGVNNQNYNYYNYCGWEAALRGYNGWASGNDYVERVKDNVNKFV